MLLILKEQDDDLPTQWTRATTRPMKISTQNQLQDLNEEAIKDQGKPDHFSQRISAMEGIEGSTGQQRIDLGRDIERQ